MKAHLLFNGLGAGNIGDEAMFEGFLSFIDPEMDLTVEVFNKDAPVVKTLPPEYKYISYTDHKICLESAINADIILLIGDTPVMEDWGLNWPMGFHSQRINELKRYGKRIHAIGVGVDRLSSKEARNIFRNSHSYINNWTVRSESCRDALLDLGVQSSNICVAADLAWLYQSNLEEVAQVEDFLAMYGVDINRPIIGINVVNEKWFGVTKSKKEIAYALDRVSAETGTQIVFFCNESREGDYYDFVASKQVISLMNSDAVILPNIYFSPSQMIGLISYCALSISQRYHFTLFSIFAKIPVLSFVRGQKLASLLKELNEKPIGTMEDVEGKMLCARVIEALNRRDKIISRHQSVARHLSVRAYKNLFFLKRQDYGPRLANVAELKKRHFRVFMNTINKWAKQWGLRQFTNWSKVWEYPWLWFNALSNVDWSNTNLVDIGSELSPMPWLLASLGAEVMLIENDEQWVPIWERIRKKTGLAVQWHIVTDEKLPLESESADIVTSFSVIEHQSNKTLAINEVTRILRSGGIFAISFDICEAEMGMTFPEWNGLALTMAEFEELIWNHPAFENIGHRPNWNIEDIPEFIEWHLKSALHHNYVVGAAVLKKK